MYRWTVLGAVEDHAESGRRFVQGPQVIRREPHVQSAEVLLELNGRVRARDGHGDFGWVRTQCKAICETLAATREATSDTNRSTSAARPASVWPNWSRRRSPHSVPGGGAEPGVYVPLSSPVASGAYAITPRPSERTSGNISDSRLRFSRLYGF